ncbi:hypothetical protein ALQ36_103035 [Pseudomonas syringae pv. primulae]|uniref:Uncharacterized protein n=2 Tax=Pseudomonas syringae group genomosp. 3 TaxID=251701 RepID=A0A3M3Y5B8_9PSED|nr:hypothetical protein ALQ36_103035 [Pseudomonas syringae pv. primulae]RMR13746.1 hypothetical protein ALP92_103094 [Pseudomonas syringae pv. primulae]RMU40435.1 hypothetical protein ALP30_103450 [Pseudomonas syringae pv. primulae]
MDDAARFAFYEKIYFYELERKVAHGYVHVQGDSDFASCKIR